MPREIPVRDIPVRVLLYPERGYGQPWLCPQDVSVAFKKSRTAKATPFVTRAGGIVDAQLAEGAYQVTIDDPRFAKWDPAPLTVPPPSKEAIAVAEAVAVAETEEEAEVKAETEAIEAAAEAVEREAELDVAFAPQAGYRLVVATLVTEDGGPVSEGTVAIPAGEGAKSARFEPCSDGNIYAVAPKGVTTLGLASAEVDGRPYCPQAFVVPYTVSTVTKVRPLEFIYWPQITITATPTITQDGKTSALTGTSVTVEFQVSDQDAGTSRTKTLEVGDSPSGVISFAYPFPGIYTATVTPPATWGDLPISPGENRPVSRTLSPSQSWEVPAAFTVVPTEDITIVVTTPDLQPLAGPARFTISYQGGSTEVSVDPATDEGTAKVPKDIPAEISLVPGTANTENTVSGSSRRYSVPLKMSDPGQTVVPGTNAVALEYEYPLTIDARDDRDQPVSGAMVHVFDSHNNHIGEGITGRDGSFVIGVGGSGTYYVSPHSVGGQSAILESATVNSPGDVTVRIKGPAGEALTDLSAYPVLTEEVSTIGPPAPMAGGPSGGGGAGYGQTVDQVMRDVLGWRPSGDVAGFQTALTGAFQLRQVEGHTEWLWQQRGYAVQADMGALTGAQASIYARAQAALDQIQPLLAGVTALNPTLYPPEDLEAIRIVIATELTELVTELALEGGPRIQRVDELFRLLVGESRKSFDPNPDHVQGQLGTMRARFGLTEEWVDTVDEERILTNFRVVVEQVLALQESWFYDRKLLSVVDANSSLGTILIWLSRGLEAVCESVDDLTFSLDSVYVDAAQRQVIEISLPGQAPLLLSDLLDWVVKAARDEGPKLIQDGGRDGVDAFAPVLRELQTLIEGTRRFIRSPSSTVPDGIRTPRVHRAFQVLEAQLIEATRLARLVEKQSHDQAPQIATAEVQRGPRLGEIQVLLTGTNFRRHASTFLLPADREDIADVPARHTTVQNPSKAVARFRIPQYVANGHGVHWQVAIANEDGTQSNLADLALPG